MGGTLPKSRTNTVWSIGQRVEQLFGAALAKKVGGNKAMMMMIIRVQVLMSKALDMQWIFFSPGGDVCA